jgi:hypothetical protein
VSRERDIPLEPPLVRGAGVVPAVEDRSYLLYIASALLAALLGGFLLAVWMPLAATDTLAPADRVPWMIQAHGWVQLQGWAGLFVAGMAVRLIPRFAGRRPISRSVTLPLLAALVIPVVLRIAIQPWADGDLAHSTVVAVGIVSALGQAGVAAVLAVTLSHARRRDEPWFYFAWAGTAWWAGWALISLWMIHEESSLPGFIAPASEDRLLWVVMLGPISSFIWAVQSRSVPIFFGRKTPPVRLLLWPGIALNAGALAILQSALFGHDRWAEEGAGYALAGGALVMLPGLVGAVYGQATRLRPRARPAARFIIVANVCAVLAGVLLAFAGLAIILHQGDTNSDTVHARDAARHLLGIGLITMLILAMARLVAPVFALERTESGVPRLFERAPFWLLLAAVVLRVTAALFASPLGYESRMHIAATAGICAWLAIALFAVSVLRAARAEPRTKRALERLAAESRRANS